MPDILHIVVTSLVLMGAAFVIGAIGFGFGLTTSPILLLILDPQTVVVVINTVAIIAFSLVLVETREHLRNRELAPMAVAAVLGTPIGVFALSTLDASVLRIAIGALVLVLTAMVVFNAEWKVPYPRISGPVLGFISSASTTGLAIGGPILVLFLPRTADGQAERPSVDGVLLHHHVHRRRHRLRHPRVVHFADRLILIAFAAPRQWSRLGYWIAMKLTGRMNEGVFRAAVIAVSW